MSHVSEGAIEWTDRDRGETAFRRKQLSEATDGEELGCSLYELPPGKRSWPYHYHTANEEALYVLAGTGTLRLGVGAGEESDDSGEGIETVGLEPGDYAAFPAEGTGGHQILNDSNDTFRYLLLSTMTDPDVTIYPEMGKFGVYVGSPPGGRESRSLEGYYRIDEDVEYWEE
jgi:uncharacterized cupin superfamily protein